MEKDRNTNEAQTQNKPYDLWQWEAKERVELIDNWKDREAARLRTYGTEDERDDTKKLLAVRIELAYLSRGITHYRKACLDKALSDYDKAIEMNPDLELAYLARGMVYADLGEISKALKDFRKSLNLANFPSWQGTVD